MRKSEINVMFNYTDGKGTYRHVVAEGPQYASSDTQADRDCVRFRASRVKVKGATTAVESNCSRTAMAKWAKEAVHFTDLPLDVSNSLFPELIPAD